MTHAFPSRNNQRLVRELLSLLSFIIVAVPAIAKEPEALALAPLDIHGRLATLNMGAVPDLPADERKLLAEIWERHANKKAAAIDEAMLLDAMLFASGVTDRAARAKYRERFDDLAAKAKDAVKDAKDCTKIGEQLMKFLHRGVMNKGYVEGQSSFAAVFDSGKYNCVSSAAMFYIVGTRVGLTLRPFSIPGNGVTAGHASLDCVDGDKRIQVEPTNPDGFDWQTKLKRPGVIVYGVVPDRKKGHEVEPIGLAAMIYSNLGVARVKEKPPQRLEAVRCYVAAVALDPSDETASNNLLSIFVNWGPELTKEKKFEEAVRVLGFGLTIAPKSKSLHTNHRIAWMDFIEATLESGRDQDAIAVIERAAKAVPGDKEFNSTSHWFRRHAGKQVEAKAWEKSLAVVERGLKVLPEPERAKLLAWRGGVYRWWSQELLKNSDVAGSMNALARGYALDPADKEIAKGIEHHTHEALRMLDAGGKRSAMLEHVTALREKFPKVKAVSEAAALHAILAVQKLADGKKFQEAVDAIQAYAPLLAEPKHRAEAGGIAYDRWARHLAGKKEMQASVDKYVEGLKAFPNQSTLHGNAIATLDQWAAPAKRAKDWDEAIRIYDIGLAHFKGNSHLTSMKKHCEKMKPTK